MVDECTCEGCTSKKRRHVKMGDAEWLRNIAEYFRRKGMESSADRCDRISDAIKAQVDQDNRDV